jgi:hypothetical protein
MGVSSVGEYLMASPDPTDLDIGQAGEWGTIDVGLESESAEALVVPRAFGADGARGVVSGLRKAPTDGGRLFDLCVDLFRVLRLRGLRSAKAEGYDDEKG